MTNEANIENAVEARRGESPGGDAAEAGAFHRGSGNESGSPGCNPGGETPGLSLAPGCSDSALPPGPEREPSPDSFGPICGAPVHNRGPGSDTAASCPGPAGNPSAPDHASETISRLSGSRAAHNREGHRSRLREKFLRGGLAGFLDYEVIELLLALGTPRRDCREPARQALRAFKSFRGVLEAPPHELQKIRGIGPRNVFGIKLIHEVSRRFLKDRMMSRPVCPSSRAVFDYLSHSLRDQRKELFKVMFLDAKNQVIEEKTLFEGTVNSSAVYPREVIQDALRTGATGLIFVHNHPSGDPEPSACDREITRDLVFAAGLLQIKVLDHIVIGNNRYFSFADRGLIEEYGFQFLRIQRTGGGG